MHSTSLTRSRKFSIKHKIHIKYCLKFWRKNENSVEFRFVLMCCVRLTGASLWCNNFDIEISLSWGGLTQGSHLTSIFNSSSQGWPREMWRIVKDISGVECWDEMILLCNSLHQEEIQTSTNTLLHSPQLQCLTMLCFQSRILFHLNPSSFLILYYHYHDQWCRKEKYFHLVIRPL